MIIIAKTSTASPQVGLHARDALTAPFPAQVIPMPSTLSCIDPRPKRPAARHARTRMPPLRPASSRIAALSQPRGRHCYTAGRRCSDALSLSRPVAQSGWMDLTCSLSRRSDSTARPASPTYPLINFTPLHRGSRRHSGAQARHRAGTARSRVARGPAARG